MRIASQEEATAVAALVQCSGPHHRRIYVPRQHVALSERQGAADRARTRTTQGRRRLGRRQGQLQFEVATPEIRDELVGYRTIINGLPILEGSEALTLENWYRDNVQGWTRLIYPGS